MRIGKVKLVDSLRRRRLRIAVAAKGNAKALPDPLCLAIGHILGTAKGEMLDQMGKTLLIIFLIQRAGIYTHADRHLTLRHDIAFHRITKPVLQLAEGPACIDGNIAAFIKPWHLRRLRFSNRRRLCNNGMDGNQQRKRGCKAKAMEQFHQSVSCCGVD